MSSNTSISTRIAIWCIAVFVFLSSIGLWEAIYSRSGSVYDRTSRIPLLGFILTLGVMAIARKLRPINSVWAIVCLILALLSWLADVNALGHIALLLLAAGLICAPRQAVVWTIGVGMMLPASSQILQSILKVPQVMVIRLAVAVICIVTLAIIYIQKEDRHGLA